MIDDLKNILAWLQTHPTNNASALMQRGQTIRYKNKTLRPRRLAIEKTEVRINRLSRHYRIVYALTADGIILVNALNHDDFDDTYRKNTRR